MRESKVLVWLGISLIAFLGLTAHQGHAASPPKMIFKIAAGNVGGTWFIYAGRMAEIINKNIPEFNVSATTGGAVINPKTIHDGTTPIGMVNVWPACEAWKGNLPFKGEAKKLRFVMSFFPALFHPVVNSKSSLRKWEDLKVKGYNINVMAATSFDWTGKVLTYYGISYDDVKKVRGQVSMLSMINAAEPFIDGKLDYFTVIGPYREPTLLQIDRDPGFRYLEISPDVMNKILANEDGVVTGVVPKGTYKSLDRDATLIGTMNAVFANGDFSEEVVYHFTKTIAQHLDSLNEVIPEGLKVKREGLVAGRPMNVPIHSGAMKYYKEAGLLK